MFRYQMNRSHFGKLGNTVDGAAIMKAVFQKFIYLSIISQGQGTQKRARLLQQFQGFIEICNDLIASQDVKLCLKELKYWNARLALSQLDKLPQLCSMPKGAYTRVFYSSLVNSLFICMIYNPPFSHIQGHSRQLHNTSTILHITSHCIRYPMPKGIIFSVITK